VTLLLAIAGLAGCAHQIVDDLNEDSARISNSGVLMRTNVASCRASLANTAETEGQQLNPQDIRLLNWNIQKNRAHNWRADYRDYIARTDLVLIQEMSLREDTATDLMTSKFLSFTPGYRKSGEVTGVMTLSNIEPLTQCSFINLEPLLKTPKTTNITQFALGATDETLVVVNLHAINFSLGLRAFRSQFDQVRKVLRDHSGPLIVSGDFNTWRKKRIEIVEDLAVSLGLNAVEFEDDQRKQAFGNFLDHIYIRGLSTTESATGAVETSDHNPMSVILSM
jgi:endonuclease/exonuclease/phosphatase (EEP) superfamily protein YafD